MRLQKDLIKSDLIKVIFILLLFTSCSHKKPELVKVAIKPFEYTLNISKKSVLSSFERDSIYLSYEDSHSLMGEGVDLYYFSSNHDDLNYYFELYFKDELLSGIKAIVSSKELTAQKLALKVQGLIEYDLNMVNSEGLKLKP